MRYPEFLQEKGRIAFIAPSFGANTEPYTSELNSALKVFKEKRYETVLGPNAFAGEGIGISNSPKKCGDELNEYYLSNNNDVIISVGGGELMCETVDYIDFEAIKAAKPKWYMGYSDNTNFIFLQATLCDTAGIYAPCAGTFGCLPWHEAVSDAFDMLTGKKLCVKGYDKFEIESLKSGENPLVPYNTTENRELYIYDHKNKKAVSLVREARDCKTEFSGRLIGGCLDCLVNLCGTKYDKVKDFTEKYKDEGIIWFLEACDLNVFSIRRAIWELKSAGWFKYTKGFVFGRPMHLNEPIMNLNRHNAVTDLLEEFNVPIVMDADIGHLPPMMPLMCGAYADISLSGNDINVNFELK
ncbi:MAG: LD-carboxypeptidase [Lachnospiraceae bacterium]|nr:LD-carboxypeptidase [Lachnospiraceae bacterium]